jgi:hypothetical protein
MVFLLPEVAEQIDWDKGYEFLEEELLKIQKTAHIGKKVADKLIKVFRKNGDETFVICHLEIQSRKEYEEERDFPLRMWTYHYKIFDKYKKPLFSLALLTDQNQSWRPDTYAHSLWGCELKLTFPIIKLVDFKDKIDILEASSNPFAKIILAHLDALKQYGTVDLKRAQKEKLAKSFYKIKYSLNDLRLFYAFLDDTLILPKEQEKTFVANMKAFEKDTKVSIPMTSFERFAMEEGIEKGIEKGIAGVARNMKLDGMSLDKISKLTDLSIEEIECL